ncbi:hypothetical protein [Sphingomonas abietis]|uniref:Uncharacterized protein n=1 Tax=Sphingomonas abietis TaxID=3012344 RepID=A0ABY7NUN9_9SPHN|nr:hypothetical protein [Sphingomonas abietis]WBO23624.1 hypothetical protein PBT88_05745 [Sphingomonas abietis]
MTMESQRFQQALARIEAAIERVAEAVASPAASAPLPANGADDGRLAALEARHRKLHDGATDALARLDRLIEGQG